MDIEEFERLSPKEKLWFIFNWTKKTSQDLYNLRGRVEKLEKLMKRFKNATVSIASVYNEKKKRIEDRLAEIKKTMAVIGSTKTKNSIMYKLGKDMECTTDAMKHVLDNLRAIGIRLSSFVDKFKKSWTIFEVLGKKFYVPDIGKLFKSFDEIIWATKHMNWLKDALDWLVGCIKSVITHLGDLAQASKHLAEQTGELFVDVGDMLNSIASELSKIFEPRIRLGKIEIPTITKVKVSDVIKERIYA